MSKDQKVTKEVQAMIESAKANIGGRAKEIQVGDMEFSSKKECIEYFHNQGLTVNQIHKLTEIRYQMVRNYILKMK